MTRSRASLGCGQTRSACGASGLRRAVWPGCAISRVRARNPNTVRSCASAFCGNWSYRRRQGLPAGMVVPWPRHWVSRTPAVWRVLRKEGIQLRRRRSWCVSTDPQFATKAADIVGLYLNPPENALVLSVDKKPSIQALERATGYVQTSSGKIVQGLKSTYKRHGTVNLFAALEVATGVIRGKTTQTKKRIDFQAFMSEIIAEQPSDRQIHVILDNYCTHKKNETWLAAHPNVTFHFTPTSASWLNQVEIWFGIFTRKALFGASFRSAEQLKQAIRDFTAAYNQRAAPFVWRKREVKGSQLRYTIVNLRN